jgi:GT2 family glycosyltransferase
VDVKVGVVVLHYRNWPAVRATLNSILQQEADIVDLCIVDNASADGSAGEIQSHYPTARVLQLSINRGYSAGMNAGIRSLSRTDAVLLMTHDCILDAHAIERLCARLEQEGQVGAVSPLLADRARPDRVWSGGGSLDKRNRPEGHLWSGDLICEHIDEPPRAAEWLDGACLLVRKQVLDSNGPLDEGYFLYLEDVEYTVRVRRAGWTIKCVPSALAWQQPGPWPYALAARNQVRFLWRNESYATVLQHLLGELRRLLRSAVSANAEHRHKAYLIARGLLSPILRTKPKRLYELSVGASRIAS